MLWMVLFLVLALVVAGVVVLYVAYPHRGQPMPVAPVVGDALRSAVAAVPVVDDDGVRDRVDRIARRG